MFCGIAQRKASQLHSAGSRARKAATSRAQVTGKKSRDRNAERRPIAEPRGSRRPPRPCIFSHRSSSFFHELCCVCLNIYWRKSLAFFASWTDAFCWRKDAGAGSARLKMDSARGPGNPCQGTTAHPQVPGQQPRPAAQPPAWWGRPSTEHPVQKDLKS